jgi:hypothetical protein
MYAGRRHDLKQHVTNCDRLIRVSVRPVEHGASEVGRTTPASRERSAMPSSCAKREYAELCAKDEWTNCIPKEIELDEFSQ